MTNRGVIVDRIEAGLEKAVARIFADSAATELPHLAGVRHRRLFVLKDLYTHLIEADAELPATVDEVRKDELFRDVSERLAEHVEPNNAATWRPAKDAITHEFYRWDA